jgi:chromosome segregation ATPase
MTATRLDNLKEIRDTMGEIATQVALVIQSQDMQDETLKAMLEEIKKLNYAIYGNGAPGLKERANSLENRIASIEERHKEDDKDKEKEEDHLQGFKWALILYGVTTVINLILTFARIK